MTDFGLLDKLVSVQVALDAVTCEKIEKNRQIEYLQGELMKHHDESERLIEMFRQFATDIRCDMQHARMMRYIVLVIVTMILLMNIWGGL